MSQVVNVAWGGSLYQDVDHERPSTSTFTFFSIPGRSRDEAEVPPS